MDDDEFSKHLSSWDQRAANQAILFGKNDATNLIIAIQKILLALANTQSILKEITADSAKLRDAIESTKSAQEAVDTMFSGLVVGNSEFDSE